MKIAKIIVLGLGDLGRRIAIGLANKPEHIEIVLAGRNDQSGTAFARLVAGCASSPVRFELVDALDVDGMTAFILRESPSIILQCAALLSPWALFERPDPLASILRDAGFALQLSAQLPAITALMLAVRASGVDCTVINCSYPDATHPILNKLGLAPTVGVGNVGMILGLAQASLGRGETRDLRVFAHHAHVSAVAGADKMRLGAIPPPRVFAGQEQILNDQFIFDGPAIPPTRELNALTTAHALKVVSAFLPAAEPVLTSAPGPLGLPGGWPVRISEGEITLDLPDSLQQTEMIQFQNDAAKSDGIERIAEDGTVYLTDSLQSSLPHSCRALAAPLHPNQALERYRLFRQLLAGGVG